MISAKKIKIYALLFLTATLLTSCYSFTGASVPPHLKTIAIPFFDDRSGAAFPNFSQDFTNTLIDKFMDDNTLRIASSKETADALLECTIISVREESVIVTASQDGSRGGQQKKITIIVKARYRDLVKKIQIFEKNFSNNALYSAESNAVENRNAAIEQAIDLVSEDILLGVVSNW